MVLFNGDIPCVTCLLFNKWVYVVPLQSFSFSSSHANVERVASPPDHACHRSDYKRKLFGVLL